MKFKALSKNGPVRAGRLAASIGVLMALSACEEGANFNLFQKKPAEAEDGVAATSAGGKTVERDVEAPEVFQVTEAGLWDGRPSLGGVWVAHPDVKDPERVIIRNTSNNKFVVGALFRRERENPGPRLQVSSDAAEALGMLAGQPSQLNVTALRREEVAEEPPVEETAALDAPDEVKATALDPVAGAAAAIDAAAAQDTQTAAAAAAAPKPAAKPKPSGLAKPYIQIGIFSVEKNANNTAVAMRQAGMVPTVKKQKLKGKTFWRVLVGPATNSAERAALLKKIKASGFTDAYFVTN
ncbi:SPOR domain-containing protein [Marimonas lutisalis]|uniref:SPOR domain-containing protein n=1 Tax=Marimonas lutisalis TaxID=2545756 RepID=UPI0010F78A5B|nr:SPOR domain-containing protein [Marimonas lutisalis]